MSRRPSMPEEVYAEYVAYAKELGFNTKLLRKSKF
jgi:lipocalin